MRESDEIREDRRQEDQVIRRGPGSGGGHEERQQTRGVASGNGTQQNLEAVQIVWGRRKSPG